MLSRTLCSTREYSATITIDLGYGSSMVRIHVSASLVVVVSVYTIYSSGGTGWRHYIMELLRTPSNSSSHSFGIVVNDKVSEISQISKVM